MVLSRGGFKVGTPLYRELAENPPVYRFMIFAGHSGPTRLNFPFKTLKEVNLRNTAVV